MKCMSALAPFASQNNIFIGSSWGATVTLVFLRMTSTLCSSLILNDICLTSGRDLELMRNRISADSASVFADRAEAKAYLESTRPYLAELDDARMSEYLDQKLIASGSKLRLAYDPTMPDSIAVQRGREFDLTPLITRMKSPTLLIYGRESPLRDLEKIAALCAANPLVHAVDDVPAGHPPSLMNIHEALIVTGFISLSAGRVSAGPSGSSTSRGR
jgi:pimeloyl-ACP methyl ester carboxylesterase